MTDQGATERAEDRATLVSVSYLVDVAHRTGATFTYKEMAAVLRCYTTAVAKARGAAIEECAQIAHKFGDVEIRDAIRALAAPAQSPCCIITKNQCGTDTWAFGQACLCVNCQAYLRTNPDPRFPPAQSETPEAPYDPPRRIPSDHANRAVDHAEARRIVQRFIAASFRLDGEYLPPESRPRFSIPARVDHDDDCLIVAYIAQCEATLQQHERLEAVAKAAREWGAARLPVIEQAATGSVIAPEAVQRLGKAECDLRDALDAAAPAAARSHNRGRGSDG